MRGLGGISLCALAAAAVAAGLSAHATSAAPLAAKSTVDVTYSCRVQKAKAVEIYAGVKLPKTYYNPVTNGKASPGALVFSTAKVNTSAAGIATLTKTQASVIAQKSGVKIDTKTCTKLKKAIPLAPKGLSSVVTATPSVRGYAYDACPTALTKITFRLQVQITAGKATSAVFAVRDANSKGTPLALVHWSSKTVTAHFADACNDLAG